MADVKRPLPRFPEPDTEPFWDATKQRELRYQVCDACENVVFPPRQHCTTCLSESLNWKTSQGDGVVYTFSIVRQSYHPAFRPLVPYVLAYVDLDEGFRMLTNVTGVPVDSVRVGQRVRVDWEEHENVALPLFTPTA